MMKPGVLERLAPIFDGVNRRILEQIGSGVPLVNQVCEHILLSGGKRLRPALFVLSAHLCGLKDGREFELAPAVEYLHAATLLHDDVVDQSDTRRGRPAAHLVYGNQGVILVGDFLLAQSLAVGVKADRLDFIDIISRAVGRMAEGEVLQLIHAHNPEITEAQYEDVIYRKTGLLIECSCRLGAMLAEAPPEWAESLRRYGRHVGLAFQIIDDTLDYSGTQAEFGKPVGHDLQEGKVTLPVIKALAGATGPDGEELKGLVRKENRTPVEFARVKELIERYD
ncbi:MAG: polyprenyl synthetase family protein, partial [Thermodesulfobacteriota bacterium]